MGLFSKKAVATGIVIKDHCLRFVEIKKGDTPAVVRGGEAFIEKGIIVEGRIEDENSFTLLVDQFVKDNNLKNQKVFVTIPETSLIVRRIDLPKDIEEDEVKSYVTVEIGNTIRLPIEKPIVDVVVSQNKPGTAILFALPEDTMRGYVQALQTAKMQPVAADVPSLSLYRLLAQFNKVEDEKNYMILQLDKNALVVSIFTNHEPELIRNYPVEEETEDDSFSFTADREHVTDFSVVLYEIERVINFFKYTLYQGEVDIDGVFITGDHNRIGSFKQMVFERFSLPSIAFDEESLLWKTSEDPQEKFLMPIGLSLKEVY